MYIIHMLGVHRDFTGHGFGKEMNHTLAHQPICKSKPKWVGGNQQGHSLQNRKNHQHI